MAISLKNISTVSFFTILSRLLGFFRDILFTTFLGTSASFEAFIAAYQIPNFFRLLLGEGALHGAVIPIYSEMLVKKGKKEANRLASSLFFILFFVFLALTAIVWIFTPFITKIFVPGFLEFPKKFAMTVIFLKISFPFLIFIGLAALVMAFLNSEGKYAVSAFAPTLLNISLIVYLLLFFNRIDSQDLRLTMLSFTVVIGGALQFFIQYFWFRKTGFRLSKVLFHTEMKRVILLFIPTALIFGTTQLNLLISRAIASFLPTGSISFLYYANRILQLPLGIFSIAIATVSLPSFSEASAKSKKLVLTRLNASIKLLLYLIIPVCIILYALPTHIISFIFEHGNFDHSDTLNTAAALRFYALGLLFFSLNRIIQSVYYAFKDTKTPLKIAIASVIVNIILNIVLMFPLKHAGLALANSISGLFQCFLLFIFLKKYFSISKIIEPIREIFSRLAISNIIVLITVYLLLYTLSSFANYQQLFIIMFVSVAIYLFSTYKNGLIKNIRGTLE